MPEGEDIFNRNDNNNNNDNNPFPRSNNEDSPLAQFRGQAQEVVAEGN